MKPSSSFACLSFFLLLGSAGCQSESPAAAAPEDRPSFSAASEASSETKTSRIVRPEEEPRLESRAGSSAESSMEEMESLDSGELETSGGLSWKDGILIINKKHGVPADYAPGVDPTAAAQAAALIDRMRQEGLSVSTSTSNYRSFDYQKELYHRYVSQYGQEQADTFSARPGFSEHQSGLAFDLFDGSGQLLSTPQEAQWLLDHSWEYGFIVRYPAGKESVTGYQAEPWHIRYIGQRAEDIARSGQTLEEYLGVEGGMYEQEPQA